MSNIEMIEEKEVQTENEETVSSVFNNYENKEDVAAKIFAELNERFITITENGKVRKGFCMEDGSTRIGLLSQCHSMQTMVSLAQDFGLDFTKNDIIPGQKGTIRQLMDDVIEDVLEHVCIRDEEGNVTEYKFDVSPYESSAFNAKYSSIDSITWVITSFLLILKHHAHIGEVCKWESQLIDVIKRGLKYINESFINDNGKNSNDKRLMTGWNFTSECEEPSLYFTFTVCECYLDFYNTFESFLKYLHGVRDNRLYGAAINKEDEENYKKHLVEYEEKRDEKVAPLKARYDEYNELVRIFRLINDINDRDELRIDGTLYNDFEANCRTVADRVWECTQNDLAEKFFYNDLEKTLTEQEIRTSTTSDVLFNTAYIINILLCAGKDETLALERIRAEKNGDKILARDKQREYDNLLESCMLAVQRAFRTYESLRNVGKDYIVDQFLIGFNEKFDGHAMPISELRKLRMRTFSLMPVLIHTNNKVSEYLIKYPHYNMSKYHQYIMDNRLTDKDMEVRWIWERDGFFSGSNYYFVLSLKEFYEYHEEYEAKYIPHHNKNAAARKKIKERYKRELDSPTGEIGKLKKDKEDLESKASEQEALIKKLEDDLANVSRPVEDAVRDIVNEELKKQFALLLSETFRTTSKVLTLSSVDATKDIPLPNGEEGGVYKNVGESMFELAWVSMLEKYCSSQLLAGANIDAKEYKKYEQKVKIGFKRTVKDYISEVCHQGDDKKES